MLPNIFNACGEEGRYIQKIDIYNEFGLDAMIIKLAKVEGAERGS